MKTGLDGRHRDVDGQISEKHGNTTVATLREKIRAQFLIGLAKRCVIGNGSWRNRKKSKPISASPDTAQVSAMFVQS